MPINLGLVSRSGSIAVGGTPQTAIPNNAGRCYLLIQNIDSSEDLWVSFAGAAGVGASGSIKLVPGAMLIYETDGLIPSNAVSVVASTGGHLFTIYEG